MATVVKELANFINGDFIKYPKYLDSYNPATGEVFLKVPDSGSEEIEQAVQAASKAFKSSVVISNMLTISRMIIHTQFDL